eukprot:1185397-Prorocentrum_minimum.AAC.4
MFSCRIDQTQEVRVYSHARPGIYSDGPGTWQVGKTVRDTRFRSEFSAAIVGIHRNGGHMLGKIGDVVLQGGENARNPPQTPYTPYLTTPRCLEPPLDP